VYAPCSSEFDGYQGEDHGSLERKRRSKEEEMKEEEEDEADQMWLKDSITCRQAVLLE
jgi:hypothetical protein